MQIEAIKGVIFDLDGTLVSSELDFSLIKAQIGCPCEQDLLDYIAQLPSAYMREEAMNIVHQHELLDAQHAKMLPGVSEAVNALKAKNIPMAIVTRNFDKAAAIKLQNNPLPIEIVLTRSDAPAKPDPSALNNIATLWNMSPSNLLYVAIFYMIFRQRIMPICVHVYTPPMLLLVMLARPIMYYMILRS